MSTQTNEKVYVNSAIFDEKVFDDGGSIIKVNIKDTDELIKFIKENRNDDKSLRLVISKKKNPKEGAPSHYSYVDSFIPRSQQTGPISNKAVVKPKKVVQSVEQEEELI